MNIKTGYFARLKTYQSKGYLPVSIALSCRYFRGLTYKKISPEWSYKDDMPPTYKRKYLSKLNKLDAFQILKELELLSNGADIVLLCHEKTGNFCHRHLFSKWIKEKTGIEIEEINIQKPKKLEYEDKQINLF